MHFIIICVIFIIEMGTENKGKGKIMKTQIKYYLTQGGNIVNESGCTVMEYRRNRYLNCQIANKSTGKKIKSFSDKIKNKYKQIKAGSK